MIKTGFKAPVSNMLLVICLATSPVKGQIFQDAASLKLVKAGIDSIYNGQFDSALEIYSKIHRSYPSCPVVVLFKGIITYWRNYPLLATSPERFAFQDDMNRCIDICEKNTNPSYKAEYLLANLCARGLLLTFYADNDMKNEVYPIVRSTYRHVRTSFDYTSEYSDFYFFTGLYNYYREVYPREHPVYRPLAFLFPRGNREKGLEELLIAARNSIFFKAEAYSLLSYIYISYEDNYLKAIYFSTYLHDLYPYNPEYLGDYVKNLLLMKKYDEAEKITNSPLHADNAFCSAQSVFFTGLILEKKYNDFESASRYYSRTIKEMASFGAFGNEYTAYAYFGLSRISGYRGDREHRNYYRKQALRLADLKKIDFD